MTRLAIMQPYLFPYIGYYQLAHAVDEFIFLDDVNFIKGGYINRNSILMGGRSYRFVLPVQDISSFRSIRDHRYVHGSGKKLIGQIHHTYSRAPYFKQVRVLVEEVLAQEERSVASLNALSISRVFEYLDLEKPFYFSSEIDPAGGQSGQDRVITLCEHRQTSTYINAPGGRSLYDPVLFSIHGMKLGFIQPNLAKYPQSSSEFVPGLSIIDVLMWTAPEQVVNLLTDINIDFPTSHRSH